VVSSREVKRTRIFARRTCSTRATTGRKIDQPKGRKTEKPVFWSLGLSVFR
jgi:hypothetical protein